jgi:hypothetical protein
VEDRADIVEVLATALTRRGHIVSVAMTAADALRLCRLHHFDLLLSDIGLPDGCGLDLVRLVKRACPGLKAVAITGCGTPSDADAAITAGFDVHLPKPVTFQQVLAHV